MSLLLQPRNQPNAEARNGMHDFNRTKSLRIAILKGSGQVKVDER